MDKDPTDSAGTTPVEQSAGTSSTASSAADLEQQMLNQHSFSPIKPKGAESAPLTVFRL